jgi:proteasome lid subunit RPN8/RPN11
MKLHRIIIDKICKHALDEYPHECFGIVVTDKKEQTVHAFENVQNKIRATDPARYTDSSTGYFIDRKKFDEILFSAGKRGEKIVAFYHSHPDHEAYFSTTDVEAQTVFGEPEFPDALHVVVSVMNGGIHDIRCYRWDVETKMFYDVGDFLSGPG